MPRAKRLNKEDITPARLREFKGFESVTDEEAEVICAFTIQLCSIVHEAHQYNKIQQGYDDSKKH